MCAECEAVRGKNLDCFVKYTEVRRINCERYVDVQQPLVNISELIANDTQKWRIYAETADKIRRFSNLIKFLFFFN